MIKPTLISLIFFFVMASCKEQTKSKTEKRPISQAESQNTADSLSEDIPDDFKSNVATEIGMGVLSILQDRKGHYWFGTNAGVYRYNGKTLIKFTIADGLIQNQVQEIQEDETGNIWFSTGGYGVNCFNGQTISAFTVKSNARMVKPAENKWDTASGDLLFCAGGGVFSFNNDTFMYLPFPKPDADSEYVMQTPYKASAYGVYATLKDRAGHLWFGTQAMGVCRYDGKSFTWFTAQGLKGPAVLAVFEDRNGILWFGNNGKGLFRYDGKTMTNVTEEKGLANPDFIKNGRQGPGTMARICAINEDDNGNLWIGTADAGVWKYDGKNLTNYYLKDGLPECAIETIYKDKTGQLWFGTNGDGVYQFNGVRFFKFHFTNRE